MDILEIIEQREGIIEKKKKVEKRVSNKNIEVEDVYPINTYKHKSLNTNNKSNSSKVYVKRR